MSLKDTSKSIQSCLQSFSSPSQVNDDDRRELLASCNKLKAALESPVETLTTIMFGTYYAVSVRVCKDMGVFNELCASKGEPLTADQLASKAGADPLLIVRFMRMITAMSLAKEVSDGTYTALPITAMLADASPLAGAIQHFGPTTEAVAILPRFFESHGYRNPSDEHDGPFQYGLGTGKHFFDWTNKYPKQQAALNAVMRMSARNRGQDWFDYYPAGERLQSQDPARTLLVDIGGGTGQNVAALVARYPALKDRLVLQDLTVAIDDIKEPLEGVQAMKHDFFEPQPVKGAKAYYMRTVLHDWPEKPALRILQNTGAAMDKDSVLLINEQILPDTGVSLFAAQTDISMMVQFASLERTLRQWLDLLDTAGFKVVKTWYPANKTAGERALFEAKIKD